jgi:hypothetical protein
MDAFSCENCPVEKQLFTEGDKVRVKTKLRNESLGFYTLIGRVDSIRIERADQFHAARRLLTNDPVVPTHKFVYFVTDKRLDEIGERFYAHELASSDMEIGKYVRHSNMVIKRS